MCTKLKEQSAIIFYLRAKCESEFTSFNDVTYKYLLHKIEYNKMNNFFINYIYA